ncbi:secreted antigen 1, partial [Babesia divergens]
VRLNFLSRYFIPKYGPGSVAERKEIPKNFYEGKLEPKDFEVYNKWLVKNIPAIKKSYKQMLAESLDMTKAQLKTDTSVGPLKYGLVFTGVRWNAIAAWSEIEDSSLIEFVGNLDNLQHCLEKVLKSSGEELPVESQAVYNHEEPSVNSQAEIFMQFENAYNEDSSAPNDSDFEAQES